jgi:hypothetical protein
MIPHPSTSIAAAEERRQGLLALAAHERLLASVSVQTTRPPLLPPLGRFVTRFVWMTRSRLRLQARPGAWTQQVAIPR